MGHGTVAQKYLKTGSQQLALSIWLFREGWKSKVLKGILLFSPDYRSGATQLPSSVGGHLFDHGQNQLAVAFV